MFSYLLAKSFPRYTGLGLFRVRILSSFMLFADKPSPSKYLLSIIMLWVHISAHTWVQSVKFFRSGLYSKVFSLEKSQHTLRVMMSDWNSGCGYYIGSGFRILKWVDVNV